MNNINEQKHYDVEAHGLHGQTIRLRLVVLIASFCFVAGFFIGGLVLPYLKYKPDVNSISEAAIDPKFDELMVSIGSQTVWAAPMEGVDVISTNLSVEQTISEYEVKASQAGYLSELEFERKNDAVEARFTFKEPNKDQKNRSLIAAPQKDFPKTLVLSFIAGKTPGTIILDTLRKNGEILSKGAAFVDMVEFGAKAPELADGQHMTRKGIFEIKTNEFGAIATLDNVQIFPILAQKTPQIGFGNNNKKPDMPKEGAPMLLKIAAFEPNNNIFRERFILVAHDTKAIPCTSQAIIIDIPRSKTTIIPHLLQSHNINVGAGKKTITFSGFCENGKPANQANLKLELAYNLVNGEINENRIPVAAAPIAVANANNGAWRQTSPTRIASPYGAKGGLISLSCRPGGGVSIGVSGLPAPQSGNASNIIFDSNNGSATAAMNYFASGNTYEINDASRPLEIRQILKVMRGQGSIMITGAGGVKNITAPSSAQIDALLANCANSKPAPIIAAPVKAPVMIAQKPLAKTERTPQAKPLQPSVAKPANKPLPKPKPVKKEPIPEAQANN